MRAPPSIFNSTSASSASSAPVPIAQAAPSTDISFDGWREEFDIKHREQLKELEEEFKEFMEVDKP